MDANEINKARKILNDSLNNDTNSVQVLNDENYIFNSNMCDLYKTIKGYDQIEIEEMEKEFPLAYSILIYHQVEQFDRLLRLIYRAQNFYCIHIDSKSTDTFKQAIQSIVSCFENVFITSKSEKIVWAGFSILKATLNCMQDLVEINKEKSNIKWKYFINMAGDEFPLKTNYELVKILKMYNGSNDIEIKKGMQERYTYKWVYDSILNDNIETNTTMGPPPHNFIIMKGYFNCVVSREFSEFVLTNSYVKDLIEWSKDMFIPDEMLWSTVAFNTQFNPPGGFKHDNDRQDDFQTVITFARFSGWKYEYDCKGKTRNSICLLSIIDLPYLVKINSFLANKFQLDNDPIAYQCMEEWYVRKVKSKPIVNMYSYCKHLKKHSYISNCP